MSGLVREESFEKSLPNDVREFVSEAFDIFDLNNVSSVIFLSLISIRIYIIRYIEIHAMKLYGFCVIAFYVSNLMNPNLLVNESHFNYFLFPDRTK